MGSEAESIEVVFTEATLPESINSCFGMSHRGLVLPLL